MDWETEEQKASFNFSFCFDLKTKKNNNPDDDMLKCKHSFPAIFLGVENKTNKNWID